MGSREKTSFAPLLVKILFNFLCPDVAKIRVPDRSAPCSRTPPPNLPTRLGGSPDALPAFREQSSSRPTSAPFQLRRLVWKRGGGVGFEGGEVWPPSMVVHLRCLLLRSSRGAWLKKKIQVVLSVAPFV